jgi:sugar phosphate permease
MQARSNITSTARPEAPAAQTTARSYLWIATLVLGYIGLYLCRKNLAVAIPMLQKEFHVNRQEIGVVASVSTIAYAVGKFLFGPVIDRLGGRWCFFLSLLLVAFFGASGGLATSITMLVGLYSANRLAGSAAWGSMMKLVPDWFSARDLAFASALLSLGFVFGGVCATLFAGQVAQSNNWRAVMSAPSAVLLVIIVLSWIVLPKTSSHSANQNRATQSGLNWEQFLILLRIRQFWIVCALSFALTLMRETFNTWTVDFFRTTGGPEMSTRMAAFLSTPFDAFGALGIVTLGWVFGRIDRAARNRMLCVILAALTALVYYLPSLSRQGPWLPTLVVALIGFLAYGPYSLLAGVLSVEIRGKEYVGTVAGIVDGVGYLAGILAGQTFGHIVDTGGYTLGFRCLALLTLISAVLCLFLYPKQAAHPSVSALSNAD